MRCKDSKISIIRQILEHKNTPFVQDRIGIRGTGCVPLIF